MKSSQAPLPSHEEAIPEDEKKSKPKASSNKARTSTKKSPARPDLIDMRGRTYGELTVLKNEPRVKLMPGGQRVLYWRCKCSCGAKIWRPGNQLRNGNWHPRCRNQSHRKYQVGAQVQQFTVTSMPAKISAKSRVEVRCVCGRIRSFGYTYLSQMACDRPLCRTTCGCNGIDSIYLTGDPNLPPNIDTCEQLFQWAGCSRQNYYPMVKNKGLFAANEHLAKIAERNHPGEGWRIAKILPSGDPNEAPPKKPRKKKKTAPEQAPEAKTSKTKAVSKVKATKTKQAAKAKRTQPRSKKKAKKGKKKK